jgi:hypothetical protein
MNLNALVQEGRTRAKHCPPKPHPR